MFDAKEMQGTLRELDEMSKAKISRDNANERFFANLFFISSKPFTPNFSTILDVRGGPSKKNSCCWKKQRRMLMKLPASSAISLFSASEGITQT